MTTKKGFTQVDYIIAIGIFLVVFALVVQYVVNFFSDVAATTNMRVMTSEANDFLDIADRGFSPENWPQQNIDNSIALYMHLDNSTKDSSSRGNTGFIVNNTNCSAAVQGKINGACSFDVHNFINMSSPAGIPYGNLSRTVEAWIKPNTCNASENSGGTILHYGSGSVANQQFLFMCITVFNNTYVFSDTLNGGNNIIITGDEIPRPGVWSHVAFSIESPNKWVYYLNGVRIKNGTLAVDINTSAPAKLNIGDRTDRIQTGFNGTIDELILYNRTLIPEEVYNHYAFESTIGRIGLMSPAYRLYVQVNNSKQYWRNQGLPWVNISSELVVINYTDLGVGADVPSTAVYDENGTNIPYQIDGQKITFNTTSIVNTSRTFTIYFDDDSNFPEQSSARSGTDNLTEVIYPMERVELMQYRKIMLLNSTNYTRLKNATQMPRDFRIWLLDSGGSYVFTYGPSAPGSGNVVAMRRHVVYQNSTGGIRKGTLNIQVW